MFFLSCSITKNPAAAGLVISYRMTGLVNFFDFVDDFSGGSFKFYRFTHFFAKQGLAKWRSVRDLFLHGVGFPFAYNLIGMLFT